MLHEDQYMDRTQDHVARIRELREAAEKEMNKFTRVADYEVRRVVGQKPKISPVSEETPSPSHAGGCTKKTPARSATTQAPIEFPPAPAEQHDHGEDA